MPSPDTKRWTPRRKAAVVEAVRGGVISIEETCRRYDLTAEEFLSWHGTMQRHGIGGLYTTALQKYRYCLREDMRVGDLVGDLETRAVSADGKPVPPLAEDTASSNSSPRARTSR